jgi:Ca-activated chloride channel family protein
VSDALIFEPSKYAFFGILTLLISWGAYLIGSLRLRNNLSVLAHKKNLHFLLSGYAFRKELLKRALFSLALCCLAVCLLRPKWGKMPQKVVHEGRNIMIALDMSRSMLAKDFMPSRLDFIKLKLRILLERLGPERVGLVLFSDKAFLHCPFTDDFNAFFSFLDQACCKVVSSGGTAISKALWASSKAFHGVVSGGANKILFLITDGEDFSPDIEAAIKTAQAEGLIVFTVGAATLEGAPVPIIDREGREIGLEKDRTGKVILTKLNEPFLRALSAKLGGEFVKISGSDADIDFIVKTIESFEKERMSSRTANLYKERHNIFCAIFMALLLLEWFL